MLEATPGGFVLASVPLVVTQSVDLSGGTWAHCVCLKYSLMEAFPLSERRAGFFFFFRCAY